VLQQRRFAYAWFAADDEGAAALMKTIDEPVNELCLGLASDHAHNCFRARRDCLVSTLRKVVAGTAPIFSQHRLGRAVGQDLASLTGVSPSMILATRS